ncbi:MAG: hypothetical protein ACR2OW_11285 [Methyloligellaceae bacterium]
MKRKNGIEHEPYPADIREEGFPGVPPVIDYVPGQKAELGTGIRSRAAVTTGFKLRLKPVVSLKIQLRLL